MGSVPLVWLRGCSLPSDLALRFSLASTVEHSTHTSGQPLRVSERGTVSETPAVRWRLVQNVNSLLPECRFPAPCTVPFRSSASSSHKNSNNFRFRVTTEAPSSRVTHNALTPPTALSLFPFQFVLKFGRPSVCDSPLEVFRLTPIFTHHFIHLVLCLSISTSTTTSTFLVIT